LNPKLAEIEALQRFDLGFDARRVDGAGGSGRWLEPPLDRGFVNRQGHPRHAADRFVDVTIT
jgi:hypothetical protein